MAPETPRAVSSRLLTMKFMQRAAAASAASPESDGSASKKRKFDNINSPQGRLNAAIDEAAIRIALEDEESKRKTALQQRASGDTHWVLKPSAVTSTVTTKTQSPALNVVFVGYGEIDSADESADGEDVPSRGRMSTRKPIKTGVEAKNNETDESGDSDSDNSMTGRKRTASQMSNGRSEAQPRLRHSQESLKAKEFRDKRKKKEVQLSKLTSISSGGGNQFSSPKDKSLTCYTCHQAGHKASDCPKRRSGNFGRKS